MNTRKRTRTVLTFAVVAMVTMSFTITTPSNAATWDGSVDADWTDDANWNTPATSPGVVNVTATATIANVTTQPDVAGDLDFSTGTLILQDNAEATIGAHLRFALDIGETSHLNSVGTTIGSGATLNVNGIGGSGSWSSIGHVGNASLAVYGLADFDGNLGLGVRHDGNNGSTGSGTVTIENLGTLNVGGKLKVYNDASTITAKSGSTLTIGSDLELENAADLDDLASDMTLFTVGRSLVQVRQSGSGGLSEIILPNATEITYYLRLGHHASDTATVTLGVGKTLDVNGTTSAGGGDYGGVAVGGTWSFLGYQGNATFNVSGDANFDGNLGLGVRWDAVDSTGFGTLNVLSTGSLDVGGELLIGGTGGSTFNIVGGDSIPPASPQRIEVGGYRQDQASATLDLDIDSTGISAINVDGAVNLLAAGTLLDVEFVSGYLPAVDDVFDVIINDGTDPVNGIFENLDNVDLTEGFEWFVDSIIGADTVGLKITYVGAYAGGSSNDVQLIVTSAIPEPSTFVLASLGLLGLIGIRRRRRRA